MNTPDTLHYTKDHEWISIEDGIATVGVTDFAQSELGDIVYVEVDTLDETLDKEEVFGTVEAVKTVSDLFMPLCRKNTINSFFVSASIYININKKPHLFRGGVLFNLLYPRLGRKLSARW